MWIINFLPRHKCESESFGITEWVVSIQGITRGVRCFWWIVTDCRWVTQIWGCQDEKGAPSSPTLGVGLAFGTRCSHSSTECLLLISREVFLSENLLFWGTTSLIKALTLLLNKRLKSHFPFLFLGGGMFIYRTSIKWVKKITFYDVLGFKNTLLLLIGKNMGAVRWSSG